MLKSVPNGAVVRTVETMVELQNIQGYSLKCTERYHTIFNNKRLLYKCVASATCLRVAPSEMKRIKYNLDWSANYSPFHKTLPKSGL